MTVINKRKVSLCIFLALTFCIPASLAGGIGYVDYNKVIKEYLFAKASMREVEKKNIEMNDYLKNKEEEFNKLETPLQKQKFEASVQQELRVKEQALNDFKAKREEAVYKRIHAVSEKIRVNKGFDAILDARSVFSGGVDVTDEMIKTLNTGGGIQEKGEE